MTDSAHLKSGELQVTNSDIKRFATDFDPEPFHLGEAAAAAWRWPRPGTRCAKRPTP